MPSMGKTASAKYSFENGMGCGFMGLFHLKGLKPGKAALLQEKPESKKQQLNPPRSTKPQHIQTKRPIPTPKKPSNYIINETARTSTSSSNNSNPNKSSSQLVNPSYVKYLAKEPAIASSELSFTVCEERKLDPNAPLYRASTGNVMLLGHLGNLKQHGSKDVAKKTVPLETKYQLGNILSSPKSRLNPDIIKSLGNEKYKQGKYEEALALYNKAISIDPNNACYYSNKSAALMGLGRLFEAVVECREAIRIDSSYHNAHYRLAKLYLRLGVGDKAVYHYKCSGRKVGRGDIGHAEALRNCFQKCIEARNNGDWLKVLNETQNALCLGADSAPQIYGLKAEALMELQRHQEAYNVMQTAPRFSIELYADLLGSSTAAALLRVRALVYVANGRFEDAVNAVQQASHLDSSKGTNSTAERVKSVSLARQNGNRLFKGSRFSEALVAYNKGLEKDPYNSVLLCNRAACRIKLGQYEKALEDCTAALALRPSYTKARLRRANCNAELEKWEAAIEDYEVVMQEIPEDQQVMAALLEAKMHLNKLHSSPPCTNNYPNQISFSPQ